MVIHDPPLVALDTNVFISGTTIATSPPGMIIRSWRDRMIILATSEPILSEVREVFSRPYFTSRIGWTDQELDRYIQDVRLSAIVVPGTTPVSVCRDPDDNMIFACAIETQADYIVSGDKDVRAVGTFNGIPVKSPVDFIRDVLNERAQL